LSERYAKGDGVAEDKVAAYQYLSLAYRQIDDTEGKVEALAAKLTPEEKAEGDRRIEQYLENGTFRHWGFTGHTCTDASPDPEPVLGLYVKEALKTKNP